MSLFTYEAIDARGRRRRGEIDAETERSARQKLKGLGLVPRSISMAAQAAEEGDRKHVHGLDTPNTILFLQQLSILLGAGMPLAEALGSISSGMESRRARRNVAALRQQVLEGKPLAQALREHDFSEIVCNMVAAGEETGQLEAVVSRLAELLELHQHLRQEVFSAILYPVIVSAFGLLVLVFLLTVVVPQVVTVFERAGGNLPWLTQMVINVSELLREHGILFFLGLVGIVIAYRLAMRLPAWRQGRDQMMLRAPGIGSLLRRIETARFSRTLGMLLAGGVPALPALHIASQGVELIPFRQAVLEAKDSLREGESLAGKLGQSGLIPHLAVRLIAVGEESGKLDEMLLRVAETFEGETSRSLKRLVTLLEPILVMLMAVMVGALALAILLPIMEMNELIR